jgi:undecaprenyl-diphosphatase
VEPLEQENAKATPAAIEEVQDERFVGHVDLTHWYTPLGRVLALGTRRISRWLGPHLALILILIVGMGISFLLSVAATGIYDAVTEKDGVAGFDPPILAFMMSNRSPGLNAFAIGYTNVAGPIGMPIIAVVAILVLSIKRRAWTPAILIAAAGVGSLLMTVAGKNLIDRVRPPQVDAVPPYELSPSFPSGHTLNALVIAGIVAYLLVIRQRSVPARVITIVIAVVFAFTIGVSRAYLGYHWFTDVLAGWALGGAWLALIITAHRLYLTTQRRIVLSAPGAPLR